MRKTHIPDSSHYRERKYFCPGPLDGDPYPVQEPQGLGTQIVGPRVLG